MRCSCNSNLVSKEFCYYTKGGHYSEKIKYEMLCSQQQGVSWVPSRLQRLQTYLGIESLSMQLLLYFLDMRTQHVDLCIRLRMHAQELRHITCQARHISCQVASHMVSL